MNHTSEMKFHRVVSAFKYVHLYIITFSQQKSMLILNLFKKAEFVLKKSPSRLTKNKSNDIIEKDFYA